METISSNKNIHSSSGVVREKVRNLLVNMCSALQNSRQQYLEMCHGLLYAHSHRGIEANGYLSHQWYDHTDTIRGVQLQDVASQDGSVMLYENEPMINKMLV
jgi:hypothetical protein